MFLFLFLFIYYYMSKSNIHVQWPELVLAYLESRHLSCPSLEVSHTLNSLIESFIPIKFLYQCHRRYTIGPC